MPVCLASVGYSTASPLSSCSPSNSSFFACSRSCRRTSAASRSANFSLIAVLFAATSLACTHSHTRGRKERKGWDLKGSSDEKEEEELIARSMEHRTPHERRTSDEDTRDSYLLAI